MQSKHRPMRMCVGCREMKTKENLVRIVKQTAKDENSNTTSVNFALDLTGKMPGRGAYVCNNLSCFELVKKNRKLEKNFRGKVPQHIYDDIEEELKRLAK